MAITTIDGHTIAYPGITGEAFDENGLMTIVVPLNFPTIEAALAFSPARVATVLGISGVKLISSPISRSDSNEHLVTYTFKGVKADWTFANADNAATFIYTPADTELPIGTNKNFKELKDTYGWKADDPLTDPNGPGHFPYWKKDNESNGRSDIAGTTSFLSSGGDFRKIYVARTIPASIFQGVNKIYTSPTGIAGTVAAALANIASAQKRGWLKRMPRWETKGLGSAVRIEEVWRLTGPNGLNAATLKIYDFAQ